MAEKELLATGQRADAAAGSAARIELESGRCDRLVGNAADHPIDQAVLARFVCTHEAVAIGVLFDLFQRVAGMRDHDVVHLAFDTAQFLYMNLDFMGCALHPGQRLVDHDSGVRQCESFAFGASGQQHGAHRSGLADAVGRDVARNELHRVIDRQASGNAAAGAVDVQVNVGFGVVRLQEQHLGDQRVGDLVVDLLAEENDAVFEQTAVNVVNAFFATAFFDDVGDRCHGENLYALNWLTMDWLGKRTFWPDKIT